MAERRTLTIEASYCSNWTIRDALREIIQNALDTKTEVDIVDNKGFWEIRDRGTGVKVSDFLLGRSSKQSDDETIGQFGEGLKIGCLVLARNDRKVIVTANGKRIDFSFPYDETWGSKLLALDISEAKEIGGTVVAIQCSDKEIEEAQNLFLKFNPQPVLDTVTSAGKSEILKYPGVVYVNGLAVTEINSLFGYNMHDKSLVNRDRSAIGFSEIKIQVGRILAGLSNINVMSRIIKEAVESDGSTSYVEHDTEFSPVHTMLWKKAFTSLYGEKICLSSRNTLGDVVAKERGWAVLNLPWSLAWSMRNIIKNANEVITNKQTRVAIESMSGDEQKVLKEAKRIADEVASEVGLDVFPFHVFVQEDFKNKEGDFDYGTMSMGIAYHVIQELSISKLVGIFIHEYTHGTTREADSTRGFENAMCDMIVTLGLRMIAEKKKNAALPRLRMITK